MALWGGRFEEGVDEFTQRFGASLPVDCRMFAQDIDGSIAHANMLASAGIISAEDAAQIEAGLVEIKSEIESGAFNFDINDEDIHMAVESELTRRIGDAGKRLHTGRSRNDQVSTDTRLYIKMRLAELQSANVALREALVEKAQSEQGVIMPGYTHMQHAQPVLFAHHMLAYVQMFERDFGRLKLAAKAANVNPLGSAALAGTTYPLNRELTTKELGFSFASSNSLDAVSDRDYLLDTIYACSVSCLHLSRLCEELILWSTSEFGFITMSDAYSTGSSIMPQKKNPDFAELIRAKSGRVIGDLVSLMVVLKALPLAYNKDLQEDKEGAFDAVDTLLDCYICATGMISTMSVNAQNMLDAAKTGYMEATDIADYLTKKGMPFREAHEVVGKLVLQCEKQGCALSDLSVEDFQSASNLFDEDVAEALDLSAIVNARQTYGSTSQQSVQAQLDAASSQIQHDKAAI